MDTEIGNRVLTSVAELSSELAELRVRLDDHMRAEDEMRPKLIELLDRYSQAKALFWAIAIMAGVIATIVKAGEWVVAHMKV